MATIKTLLSRKTLSILCSFTLLLVARTASAQNFLLNLNFSSSSGSTPPSGWTNNIISGVSGVDNWYFGKHPKFFFAPPFDNNYAIFDSYNGGSAGGTATNGQAENVALESPAINTTGLSNLYLSFDYMNLYNGGFGYLEVSVDNGSNWSSFASYSTVTSVPANALYNMGSYIGYSQFKIRFRWDNSSNFTYSGYLAIDNLKLFERYSTDAAITDLAPMYDKSCPSSSQPVSVVITNTGSSTISNIPVVVNVTGATTTTLNYTYTGSIGSNSSVNVSVGTINTSAGGNVNFEAFTTLPGENNYLNDTFRTKRVSAAIASSPTALDGFACGSGSRVSIGATRNPGDSTFWYKQSSGGNIIGSGSPFLTPPINGTTTFYAQNAQLFNNEQWAYQGPYRFNGIQYSGSYFNITTNNDVLIDSFWQHFAYGGPYQVYVYYKTGTYSGFESNSSAWTLYETKSINSNGYGHMVPIKLSTPLNIPAGQQYAFYIMCDGMASNKCISFKNAYLTFTNADMSVAGGVVSSANFNGVSGGYTWDGRVFYRKLCLSNRVSVKAVIKPRPIGAFFSQGSTFQGQYRIGDAGNPDVVEAGKTVSYELNAPTGHSNSSQGSTWSIIGTIARTKYGVIVPSTEYTFVPPSSSGPGTITFTPKSFYLDSLITFITTFKDLGPNFCDSSVKRTLVVAPTPYPGFKYPSAICLGDAALFENTTSFHSGNASYMWYFGNGDSSDLQNPVYEFKTPGTFQVKLVAKSFPWGVLHDTTITVEVNEIPDAKFKANNKCFGIPLSFQNLTTIGNGSLTYDWDFGDGSPHSSASNPNHSYSTPGAYKVTLIASANGCISKITKNAYSFPKPVANFVPPSSAVCERSNVTLQNTSTISEGNIGAIWSYGDATVSTQYDGVHPYSTAGTYQVKLVSVSEFDCRDSIIKSVSIKPSPNPDFSGNQFCSRTSTIFANSTVEVLPNPTYSWTFSDNYTSNTKNVTRGWSNEGPYSATLSALYSNGCSASVTKDFVVLAQPFADFTVQDICAGQTADFVNKSVGDRGNIQYNWDFGNATGSSLRAPRTLYNPTATTTYTVSLIVSYPGACSDTVRKTITVSESPVCDFTYKELGFMRVSFTPGNSTYTKYSWLFGEGGGSSDVAPTYQYLYTGNFSVTMKATNIAGCSCEITKRITEASGISNTSFANGISIYPNPSQGEFTVSNTSEQPMTIEVFSVLGDKVYSSSSSEGNTLVSLGEHAAGMYLVKVTVNGATSTFRMIVNN